MESRTPGDRPLQDSEREKSSVFRRAIWRKNARSTYRTEPASSVRSTQSSRPGRDIWSDSSHREPSPTETEYSVVAEEDTADYKLALEREGLVHEWPGGVNDILPYLERDVLKTLPADDIRVAISRLQDELLLRCVDDEAKACSKVFADLTNIMFNPGSHRATPFLSSFDWHGCSGRFNLWLEEWNAINARDLEDSLPASEGEISQMRSLIADLQDLSAALTRVRTDVEDCDAGEDACRAVEDNTSYTFTAIDEILRGLFRRTKMHERHLNLKRESIDEVPRGLSELLAGRTLQSAEPQKQRFDPPTEQPLIAAVPPFHPPTAHSATHSVIRTGSGRTSYANTKESDKASQSSGVTISEYQPDLWPNEGRFVHPIWQAQRTTKLPLVQPPRIAVEYPLGGFSETQPPLMADSHVNESLYSDFKQRKTPRKFFTLGRAFMTLWSEPAGPSVTGFSLSRTGLSLGPFGEAVYSKVRRFIVVREGVNECIAVPILTYNGRGVAKRGITKSEHAIVFTGREPPQPIPEERPSRGEIGLSPIPIRINPDKPEDKLSPLSRVCFTKVFTIAHNVKVKNLGQVSLDTVKSLREQFREALFNERTGPVADKD